MHTEDTIARPLSPRIVLISILGFWALYFAILSFRAVAIYHDHLHVGARAIVSVACISITWLFYLILRRVPIARLGLCIAVAAIVAAPAAILYSSINWTVFHYMDPAKQAAWTQPKPAAPALPVPPTAGPGMTAPPAPPAPAMTVGTMPSSEEMSPLKDIADQASNGYFFLASWAALYLALCYAAELGAVERRAARLQAAAQAAELRALRYQVNPHFLFNTLNSLSSLILTGRGEAAETMILNLATFFRTSLTGDPTEDVPLADEIQLQRLYLDIEAVRFPDRLVVAIDLPDALRSACVPGLILQPLVENAVKYGVSRSRRPVTVRIEAQAQGDRLRLIVADDGDGIGESEVQGTGVGLRNVRDRLAARYGTAGHSRWDAGAAGGFTVTLDMPLVRHGC